MDNRNIDPRGARAVGARIRYFREREDIKGTWLIGQLKVSQGLLSQWESGDLLPPAWRLQQLAELLKCRLSFLVAGDAPPHQLPVDVRASPGARAGRIRETFKQRLQVAIGQPLAEWQPCVLPTSHLPFLFELCELTLLDISALDAGADMKAALPILNAISSWAEQAFNEGIPGAGPLLFDVNDKAVHFNCYVGDPAQIIASTKQYFGTMSRVSALDKTLWRRQRGRMGDVYKVAVKAHPGLRSAALQLFEQAYPGNNWCEYHCIRSPAIVAASTNMCDSDFQKYIGWISRALDAGRHTGAESVHLLEGRADAHANRYAIMKNTADKQAAIRDMQAAQKLARRVAKDFGGHSEFWLRTRRPEVAFWDLGIKDHISAEGMPQRAAVAEKAWVLHRDALFTESDRLAAAMLAIAQKYDR